MPARIHVVSDLHDDLDHNAIGAAGMPPVDCDLVVVAGDAQAPGTEALKRVRELYPNRDIPLVYCAGNHDYYSEGNKKLVAANPALHTTYEFQRENMPRVAEELGIFLLDDSAIELPDLGIRLIGGTLWTDMSARPDYMSINEAMRAAGRMNDYRLIKTGRGRSKDVLRPSQTIAAHRATVSFLEEALANPVDGLETVVVTHHAPSLRSLKGYDATARTLRYSDMDWCYATDLERLMVGDSAPALWLHGHIHSNQDYVVGRCRVVANPRGYPLQWRPDAPRENPNFDPALVVEVGHDLTPTMRM